MLKLEGDLNTEKNKIKINMKVIRNSEFENFDTQVHHCIFL